MRKIKNYLKKGQEIERDQDGQIRLVEHRELGVASSTRQRHRGENIICKNKISEKVKNKNIKLKTGIKVKEADKSTEDNDNKSSDKISKSEEICEFMNYKNILKKKEAKSV